MALRCLIVLGAKPMTFSEDAALAVMDSSAETLDTLVDSGLLEVSGSDRYILHETIHDYLATEPVANSVLIRKIRFFLPYLEAHQKNYALIETDFDNILASIHTASVLNWPEAFVFGVINLFTFLNARGMYEPAYILLTAAEQAANAIESDKRLVQAGLTRVYRYLGILADNQKEYVEAETRLLAALALAREREDDFEISTILSSLGIVYLHQDDIAQSQRYLRESVDKPRELEDDTALAQRFAQLGATLLSSELRMEGKNYLLEAESLARRSGDKETVSIALANLADLEHEEGNNTQAAEYIRESIDLARESGHVQILSLVLTIAAGIADSLGENIKARELYVEAVTYTQAAGNLTQLISLLQKIGSLAHVDKFYPAAEASLQLAMSIARSLGDKEHLRDILTQLGEIVGDAGEDARAESYLQEALTLAREIQDTESICALLIALGRNGLKLGDYAQAGDYLLEALTLTQDPEAKKVISDLLYYAGRQAKKQQDAKLAEQCYKAGLEIAQEINYSELALALLEEIAVLASIAEDYARAEEHLLEAWNRACESLDPSLIRYALLYWSELYIAQDLLEATSATAQEALDIEGESNNQAVNAWSAFLLARVAAAQGNNSEAHRLGQESLRASESVDDNDENIAEVRNWLASLPSPDTLP